MIPYYRLRGFGGWPSGETLLKAYIAGFSWVFSSRLRLMFPIAICALGVAVMARGCGSD